MSKILELAQNLESASKQQAANIESEIKSVMQQHKQAIERDLSELRNEISNSIRASSEAASKALQDHMTARPKRIARQWWGIAALGLILALSLMSLSVWLGVGALKETRATVMDCPTDSTRTETVKCVLVKRGKTWTTDKADEVYMEIR